MGTPLKLKHTAADPVRLAFPDLFTPTLFTGETDLKKKRYNAVFLISPVGANAKLVETTILAAATEAFEGNVAKARAFINAHKGNSNKFCYMTGDTKEYDGFAGNMALSAHRPVDQGKPGIFDCTRAGPDGKPAPLTEEDGKPYAGCYVNASLEIWIQKTPPTQAGVRCSMAGVFFANEGDHFAGGKTADAGEFDVSEGTDSTDDLA